MANNTITVTYRVNDDGSLEKITQKAKNAANATDKATGAADKFNKKQKGVAGATSNTTKAFSKMTTGITSGLVPAYATLAANIFAITAAFGVLSRNDAVKKLAEGLQYTGNAAGQNLGIVSKSLQEITNNAISAEQAMRATAVSVSAGFSTNQLQALSRIAKGASLALGRDMGDALDRLVRGTAKLEPEILDELGIMVRLDDAVRKYADSVKKSTNDLTQYERRMAFTNAVIADGTLKYAELAATLDASPYSKLSSSFTNLSQTLVGILGNTLTPIIGFLAANSMALTAVLSVLALSISKQLLSSLGELASSAAQASTRLAAMATHGLANIKPAQHMGKVYNEVAASTDRSTAALKRMQKSATMTVNMMARTNPLLSSAIKARGALTRAIYLQDIAQIKSNFSTALGMIETHGLTIATQAHMATMGQLLTTTRAAIAGQTTYTAAMIIGRAATTALTSSLVFLGGTLLTVMPYIVGIGALLAIVGPLVMSLFKDPEDKFSEQIKKNTERLDSFNDVAAQYTRAISRADTASKAWYATIKPLSGLFDQINTLLEDTAIAAETDRIIRYTNAVKDLDEAQRKSAGSILPTSFADWLYDVADKQEEVKNAINMPAERTEEMTKVAINAMGQLQATFKSMDDGLKKSKLTTLVMADAQKVLTGSTEQLKSIYDKFAATDSTMTYSDLQKAIKELSDSTMAAVKAFEGFNDIIAQAEKLVSTGRFGLFSKELDNITDGMKEIKAIGLRSGAKAAEEAAEALVKVYGITFKMVALLPESIKPLTATQQLALYQERLEKIANSQKQLELDTLTNAALEHASGSNQLKTLKETEALSYRRLNLAHDILIVQKEGTEEEYKAKLEVLRLEADYMNKIKQRYDFIAGKASEVGMGAAATAAIAGQGAVAVAESATVGSNDTDLFKTEEDKKAAVAAAQAAQARGVLKGVAQDLAAIGPEGALMSSVISGTQNMAQAWSLASQTMGDATASMSTKIQAGLGAVSATIGAIGAMQKAASDNKIRGIDQEIAAEKKRDGSSAASLAKIAGLEKKKEQAQRKAFEQEKKMKMAQTIIATAQGAMAAYTSLVGIPVVGPALAAVAAAAVVAMGAQQLSMISSTSFQGGGSISNAQPSKISAGERSNTVDLAKARSPSGELAYARGAQGTGTGMTNYVPSAFTGRATGGNTSFMVGEQGPEIFTPDRPGRITPADEVSAGSAPMNINFSINAIDTQGIEEVLISQRGNLIGMLREAANAHGENFMEKVNVNAYTSDIRAGHVVRGKMRTE